MEETREYETASGTIYRQTIKSDGINKPEETWSKLDIVETINIQVLAYLSRGDYNTFKKNFKEQAGIGKKDMLADIIKRERYKGTGGILVYVGSDKNIRHSSEITEIDPPFIMG